MNKSHFTDFVENPTKVREKDADILAELARNYPYSALIHTLLAKAQAGTPRAKESLASAALRIPDRGVLKEVIESSFSRTAVKEPASPAEPTTDPGLTKKEAEPSVVAFSAIPVEEVDSGIEQQAGKINTFDELQENLRQLRAQRERFQQEEEKQPQAKDDESILPSEENAGQEVKEIPIQQLPERLQEIVQNREELQINDPKRIEQINLIDSFIEKSSSIARKYRSLDDEDKVQSDLTDNYHFTPQDLVTENLAKIMVRQGKPDKAIDIYEKLVLKYPQKKAYFATCIEKLKTPDK